MRPLRIASGALLDSHPDEKSEKTFRRFDKRHDSPGTALVLTENIVSVDSDGRELRLGMYP
jgi:hypothetical protein